MAKEINMNGRELPQAGERYRHFKDREYEIVCIAAEERTDEPLVIYKALYGDGKIWARPVESFLGDVNLKKHPEATQKFRFEKIAEAGENAAEEKTVVTPAGEAAVEVTTESEASSPQEEKGTAVNEAAAEVEGAEDFQLDPMVEKFLDAKTIDEKLDILGMLHGTINDAMIDTMAMASGLEIEAGPVEDRYHDLRDCLRTINQYEADSNRLR